MWKAYAVGEWSAGSRLDDFLADRLQGLSRMRIAALVGSGAVRVNGSVARAGTRLRPGEKVEVDTSGVSANSMTPEPLPLEIVYEDEHVIAVNKPAGMLMHPTRGVKTGTLANALAFHLNRGRFARAEAAAFSPAGRDEVRVVRPGLVHRLDRATSGLVVAAKTRAALSRLSEHFGRRLVGKRYLALLHGKVGESELVINAPIGRAEDSRPQWRVLEGGRPAETRLRVIETRGGMTFAELEPVTGRTNQLRIHCAHLGHPVAGDEWHAADGLPRLCLHASLLSFRHPHSNEPLTLSSPAPESVRQIWDRL